MRLRAEVTESLAGVGHFPQSEAPRAVAAAVRGSPSVAAGNTQRRLKRTQWPDAGMGEIRRTAVGDPGDHGPAGGAGGVQHRTAGRPPGLPAPRATLPVPSMIGRRRHLYLQCRGRGAPTIILESGYHNSSDPWSQSDAAAPAVGPAVLPALARGHRVCAYDRPGTVRYSVPAHDRRPQLAGVDAAHRPRRRRRPHALLDAAHLPGPYILVGHSLGGLFIRLYAQIHPDQVGGLVFVDASGSRYQTDGIRLARLPPGTGRPAAADLEFAGVRGGRH